MHRQHRLVGSQREAASPAPCEELHPFIGLPIIGFEVQGQLRAERFHRALVDSMAAGRAVLSVIRSPTAYGKQQK